MRTEDASERQFHTQCSAEFLAIGYEMLKTLDTIGNFQRLVFTVGVSQHMHKITNL